MTKWLELTIKLLNFQCTSILQSMLFQVFFLVHSQLTVNKHGNKIEHEDLKNVCHQSPGFYLVIMETSQIIQNQEVKAVNYFYGLNSSSEKCHNVLQFARNYLMRTTTIPALSTMVYKWTLDSSLQMPYR